MGEPSDYQASHWAELQEVKLVNDLRQIIGEENAAARLSHRDCAWLQDQAFYWLLQRTEPRPLPIHWPLLDKTRSN